MPAPFSQDCQVGERPRSSRNRRCRTSRPRCKTSKQICASSRSARPAACAGARGSYTEQIERLLAAGHQGSQRRDHQSRRVGRACGADAARRIKNEVALNEPDLVLWQVGTNDALAYVPLDELEETVVEHRALAQGAQGRRRAGRPAIRRPDGAGRPLRAVRELLRKIAAQENVMIVRRYEAQRADRAGRRRAAAVWCRTSSSAPRPAMPAWRSTWRARSRSAFSASGCACVRSRPQPTPQC